MTNTPTYFDSADEFTKWLAKNHEREGELLVGFRKAHVADRGLTYQQALDAALCHGWIDGVRRSLGPDTWSIRFTPRRRGSIWSLVNIRRMKELLELGIVAAAGRAAYEQRDETKSAMYSYEQRTKGLDTAHEALFRKHRKAWAEFEKFPPSYKTASTWWVMSAKRDETRLKRLTILIDHSARGQRLPALTSPTKRSAPNESAPPVTKPNARKAPASAQKKARQSR